MFLKSITVPEQIIIEVMNHIERTYLAAFEAAKTINHLLYENNHNINLSLIESIMNSYRDYYLKDIDNKLVDKKITVSDGLIDQEITEIYYL